MRIILGRMFFEISGFFDDINCTALSWGAAKLRFAKMSFSPRFLRCFLSAHFFAIKKHKTKRRFFTCFKCNFLRLFLTKKSAF